jgi:cell division protein FtsB
MKRSISIPIVLFLVGISVAAFVAYAAYKEAGRNKEIEELISSLNGEKQKIENENNDLKEKIAYLETVQYPEKVAKEKLNMQNPDEKVAIIKTRQQQNSEQKDEVSQVADEDDERPNYIKWYEHFFAY